MMKQIVLLLIFSNCVFAQQPKLVLPIGHTEHINSVEFSPDGKKIVTASDDDTAKIWDVASGKLIADLVMHSGNVNSAFFSNDGKKIVTSSVDKTAIIWNAETGKHIVILKDHTNEVKSAVFSPTGNEIRTFSYYDSNTKIWDANNGVLISDLKEFTNDARDYSFSTDWKKIVIPSEDNSAKIWDFKNRKLISVLKAHTNRIRYTSFSLDGKKIITTYHNDKIHKIWNAESGKLITDLNVDSYGNISGILSPDGKKYATLSNTGTTQIWNTETGNLHSNIKLQDNIVVPVVFSPDSMKILTSSQDNNPKIWDVASGILVANLKGCTDLTLSASFSSDGKKILVATDNTAKIWDTAFGKLISDFKGHTSKVDFATFSPDGKQILTTSNGSSRIWDSSKGDPIGDMEGTAIMYSIDGKNIITTVSPNTKIYDAKSGNLVSVLTDFPLSNFPELTQLSPDGKTIVFEDPNGSLKKYHFPIIKPIFDLIKESEAEGLYSVHFSLDGKKILAISEKSVKIWNTTTGILNIDLVSYTKYANSWDSPKVKQFWSACFSQDGEKILTTSDNTAKIWDAKNGKLLLDFEGHTSTVYCASFSPDETKVVTASEDNTAKIWDANTGKKIIDLIGHTESVKFATFFNKGKKILTFSEYDYSVKIWDAITGKLIFDLKEHTNDINSVILSLDEKKLVTSSNDNTTKIWDVESGKLLYTSVNIDNFYYINIIPSGYYKATPTASKLLHYVTKDLKVISFDQLDIKYNRPDKVLEAIGSTDIDLINSYKKAYEKRIKKLEINTTAFNEGYSVPEADFENRDAVEYEQKNETLTLHIKGLDNTYKLDRYNVWVNEVPVFGLKGKSIRDYNSHNLDTTVTIKLSQGENRIETSITNVNAIESYRMPLNVNYAPSTPYKEKTYFIGIGIDTFANNKYNLKYSTKDIRDLTSILKQKLGNNVVIDTLFNENVTVANVKALKLKLQQTNENDKIIISYSGHGVLSKNYDYYLSTFAIDFETPENSGLAYDELENLLDNIPARKKLMLIDACHSGEVDKEEIDKINISGDNATVSIGAKGATPIFIPDAKKIGMKNSFALMQELFVNVGRSTGATIISAAAGTQFALEDGGLKNGVFTYSILEFIKNNSEATISKLKEYVNKRVPELTNGLQVPTARTETNAIDWKLW